MIPFENGHFVSKFSYSYLNTESVPVQALCPTAFCMEKPVGARFFCYQPRTVYWKIMLVDTSLVLSPKF